MLMENRYDELTLMYSLLKRTENGLVLLKNSFAAYIKVLIFCAMLISGFFIFFECCVSESGKGSCIRC